MNSKVKCIETFPILQIMIIWTINLPLFLSFIIHFTLKSSSSHGSFGPNYMFSDIYKVTSQYFQPKS
jgi:hypothetical protein